MGGFGSGGRRAGAGRKSKGARILNLHGGRDRKPKSATAGVAFAPVDPPKSLTKKERIVWNSLAPLALARHTLTSAEAGSLGELCVAIVERDRMRVIIDEDGWTFKHALLSDEGEAISVEIKKHPLIAEYRQWMIRVEAGRARFKLAPFGKEIVLPEKEADPFAEFDMEAGG